MLGNMKENFGVCAKFLVPSLAFVTQLGTTCIDFLLRASARQGSGVFLPSFVYVFGHTPTASSMGWTNMGSSVLHL